MRARACVAAPLLLGLALQAQTPPVQPPVQRPPGQSPASQIPPHPAPQTAPRIQQSLPTFEGQNVSSLELAGWADLDPAPLLRQLPQQPRQPFHRADIDRSIAMLKAKLIPQGRLKDVQLEVVPEPEGVRVLLILEPGEYLGMFQFPGALRFSYTRLLEAAAYQRQEPYSIDTIARAQNGLLDFFQHEGYFVAQVHPELKVDRRHGLVNVAFHTSLGPRAHYGSILFHGVSPQEAAALRGALGGLWARMKRASVRPGGDYSPGTLNNAVQYLQGELDGQGHLVGQVTLANAKYHPSTNLADVTFNVQPGPIVHLKVEGAFLWPWTRKGLIPLYQENRLDPELIQEGTTNLTDHFTSSGYFNVKVTSQVTHSGLPATASPAASPAAAPAAQAATQAQGPPPSPAAPAETTIVYHIEKGPRHDVEHIEFTGNKFFSDDDLLAQVTIKPEWLLSHGSFSAALLRTSVNNIENLYRASGYSSIQVKPEIHRPNGNVVVQFVITEGPQDYVHSLQFVGNTLNPSVLAPNGLMIGPGTPFSQKAVNQDRSQILATYLSRGYLNASLRARAQQDSGHPHQIDVQYLITEGPQVRTATVTTVGRQVTQQRLIDNHTTDIQAEKFLTENDMLTSESHLYEPGIFDWAEVSPRRPITTQQQEDVIIKVHEAKRNSLVYGFGFDLTNRGGSIPSGTVAVPGLPVVGLPKNFKTSQATFWGPSANIEYTRINLRGKAETLNVGAFAGRLDQRGSFAYTDPHLFWSQYSGNLLVSGEYDQQNPIFSSRNVQLGYQLERPLNSDKTTNLFLRYNFSQTGLSRLLIPALVPERDRHVRLSTLSATFLRDTRDNPLDAHKGFLESYELDYNPAFLGSSVDFARVLTQTAYYRTIPAKIVWANSLRFGFDHAFGSSFVPLSEAFFSGGGSTLRGFPLDGAGPQRTIPACGNPSDPATCSPINVPVGGNALLIINSEFRIPVPQIYDGLGVALFYDGGNVFSHLGFSNLGASYTNTLGVGLRYQTPVGPVRIDIGHNLNAPPGVKSTQYFITLGQAF